MGIHRLSINIRKKFKKGSLPLPPATVETLQVQTEVSQIENQPVEKKGVEPEIEDPEFQNKIACGIIEIVFQIIVLPACMFVGIHRLVILPRKKYSYYVTALG